VCESLSSICVRSSAGRTSFAPNVKRVSRYSRRGDANIAVDGVYRGAAGVSSAIDRVVSRLALMRYPFSTEIRGGEGSIGDVDDDLSGHVPLLERAIRIVSGLESEAPRIDTRHDLAVLGEFGSRAQNLAVMRAPLAREQRQ